MARRERPLDAQAGPVQALAHDLRRLRAEAGGPTYRALARTAGYSATTLSEAAGGSRLPTLDVLLAYVGACGGDPEPWRARWTRIDAQLNGPGTAVLSGAASRTPRRPRRWRWAVVGAGAAAALAAVVLVTGLGRPDPLPASTAVPGCPPVAPDAAFTAVVKQGGAHVRAGAHRDEAVLRTVPHQCVVGFTGVCVGQLVRDLVAGYPDVRWFTVAGGGVVASAVVRGNPPRGLAPVRCPGDTPLPSSLRLSRARSPKPALAATSPGARIIGFAVAEKPGRWRQLDLVEAAAGETRAPLDVPPGAWFAAVGAVCLGGDGPTAVTAAWEFRPDRAVPLALDPGARAAAAAVACRYPDRG